MSDNSIQTILRDALKQAMRERDRQRMSTLRSALSRLDNAAAIDVSARPAAGAIEASPTGLDANEAERLVIDESSLRALVIDEASELETSAELIGAGEAADTQRAEAQALRELVTGAGPEQ